MAESVPREAEPVDRTAGDATPGGVQPVTAQHSRLYRLDARLTTIAFYVLLAAGLAFRIYLFYTPAFIVDSDNAVVYLQTKHISEGEFTWFFWGQSYGGTLLDYIAAAAMLVFGAHIQVLSIVSTLIFVIAVFLIRHIGTQAFDRITGTVAAILFWFSGYYTLKISISESGFYGPSLVLGLATIAVALRTGVRRPYLQWAIVGLLAGLAFWQSPMGAMLAAPALVILIIRQRSWRHLLVGAVAVVIGALPWIIQFATSLSAVKPKGRPSPRSLVTFFTELMPTIVSADGVFAKLTVAAICIGLLALLAVLAVRRRNAWLFCLVAGALLVVCVVTVGAGVVLSTVDVRYAIFVMPALAIAAAWIITRVRFLGIAAMIVAALLTFGQVKQLFGDLSTTAGSQYIVGDIRGLGDYLEQQNITHAFGDYWVSYAVSAETNERAQVASLSGELRYAPYAVAAAAQDPVVVIVLKGNDNDTMLQSKPIATAPGTTRTEVAGYAVYRFTQPIDVFDFTWALF
ncbi:glycosyltransferase family 39 protein [Subtercola sp. PAMC28395]|uniref:ArnT family glycosyltransferase n=1 Tax=Subtercola sp. PAMC28395 TaxID=2846775 RepID=UPI001C0CB307|nr:glycosyltransferase family 39 protein [Subtercola sp. PAMC28395]QWT25030.1 glycosyltransferase family 39 protein [Subtercola sp. PAMC28395]